MYAWELSDRQRFAKKRAARLPPAVAAGGSLDFSLQPVPARWRRLLWLFAALAPPAILLAAHGFEQASCAGGAVVYQRRQRRLQHLLRRQQQCARIPMSGGAVMPRSRQRIRQAFSE